MPEIIRQYQLPVRKSSILTLPFGGEVLHIAALIDRAMIYIRENTTEPRTEARVFCCYPSNEPFPTIRGSYLGSVYIRHIMWHVYEEHEHHVGK